LLPNVSVQWHGVGNIRLTPLYRHQPISHRLVADKRSRKVTFRRFLIH